MPDTELPPAQWRKQNRERQCDGPHRRENGTEGEPLRTALHPERALYSLVHPRRGRGTLAGGRGSSISEGTQRPRQCAWLTLSKRTVVCRHLDQRPHAATYRRKRTALGK